MLFSRIRQFYFNLSIAKKMYLFYAFSSLIPILTLAFVSYKISSENLVEKAIVNSVQQLNMVARNLETMLSKMEQAANLIVAYEDVQNLGKYDALTPNEKVVYEQSINYFFDLVNKPENLISSGVIYSTSGTVIGTASVNMATARSHAIMPDNPSPIFSDISGNYRWEDIHPIEHEYSSPRGISLNKKIINGTTGEVLGYLVLNVNAKTIYANYLGTSYGRNGYYLLANRNGEIVSAEDSRSVGENIAGQPYFQWAMQQEGDGRIFTIDGQKFLVTTNTLNAMDWIVFGIIPLDEVTDNAAEVTTLIFGTGLLCLFFGLLVAWLASYSITRPIAKLVQSISKVGLGDFSVTVHPRGTDEVGILLNRFNKMTMQISTLMNRMEEEQRMKRNYELMALQGQIYPHFLYNTLDNLAALIQMGMKEEAYRMIRSLAAFYKIALSKGDSLITLEDEVKHAHHYMEIQKIRYADDFDYSINVEPGMMTLRIPKLSIQPILENAIYHGIRKKRGKGRIEVEGYLTDQHAVIRVTDNGAGMEEALGMKILTTESPVRSFGLKSVHDRLQMYFGSEYGVRIESRPGEGTEIKLLIPAHQEVRHEDLYRGR
jgi:two-component system sensor histidine kinase YesM